MTGVPIAYPRMVFLEAALDSKFNPLLYMAKSGTMGLGGFLNKFNGEAELLDDLHLAKHKRVRVSFLSGDVHCAAVGVLKTFAKGKKSAALDPAVDHRYMINVVSSAIVNTPPPAGVISMVSSLATNTHRTLHHADTDETMIPIFTFETDGSKRKQKYIMGKRNWCCVDWDGTTGALKFDIRVEKQKGGGVTVGYDVSTPPPRWSTSS
ncbi:hypothetical protein HWV62_17338 [Athelia sp. TMB]|nr:hypothetical protein HWV62_33591 [Athelia sp. TMB]KAF7972658.1 hypothetical protein HWV62_17338 [Athelia sp. TMB]